jgi:hypothetical protein
MNPAAKHLDLENQKLHPGIVPGHEKMREKGQEREKKVRIHGFSSVILFSCIFSHLYMTGRFWIPALPSQESKTPSVGKMPGKIKVKRGVEGEIGRGEREELTSKSGNGVGRANGRKQGRTERQGNGFWAENRRFYDSNQGDRGSDETTPVPTILGEEKALHFSPAKEIWLNFTSSYANCGENYSTHNRLYLQGYPLFFPQERVFVFQHAPSTILPKDKTLSRIFESGRAFFIIPNKQGVLRVLGHPACGQTEDFSPSPEG